MLSCEMSYRGMKRPGWQWIVSMLWLKDNRHWQRYILVASGRLKKKKQIEKAIWYVVCVFFWCCLIIGLTDKNWKEETANKNIGWRYLTIHQGHSLYMNISQADVRTNTYTHTTHQIIWKSCRESCVDSGSTLQQTLFEECLQSFQAKHNFHTSVSPPFVFFLSLSLSCCSPFPTSLSLFSFSHSVSPLIRSRHIAAVWQYSQ